MKTNMLLTIGLATLLASAVQADQERLAQSIKEAHIEASRTSEQLNTTIAAINTMTQQKKGDLRPAYDAYCAEVIRTRTASEQTRARVLWMGGDGRKYFTEWQATIDGIANASLKKKAQKRLNAVKESYGKVESSLKTASEKFVLFLSDLGDIQKTLAADITPGRVASIKSVVKSANSNHQSVNKSISAALKEMDKMEKSLTTQAQ